MKEDLSVEESARILFNELKKANIPSTTINEILAAAKAEGRMYSVSGTFPVPTTDPELPSEVQANFQRGFTQEGVVRDYRSIYVRAAEKR